MANEFLLILIKKLLYLFKRLNLVLNSIYLRAESTKKLLVIMGIAMNLERCFCRNSLIYCDYCDLCLGFVVKKYTCKIRIATILIGLMIPQWGASSALADNKIRLNPAYKAPVDQTSFLSSETAETDDIRSDFIQFLNPHEEDEQYIQLTEPEKRETKIISLGDSHVKRTPLFQVNHEYRYDPSISFNLPNTSPATSSNLSGGLGGSQVILSLNPSRRQGTDLDKVNSLKLILGSSYARTPVDRYASMLNNNMLSQRAYNLSLGLGYSGFRLGASFSRNDFLFSSDMTGYDLGFGYMGNSWSANFKVGEYRKDRSLLLSQDYDIFEHISAYELGAAYRLFSNVSLTGRFTYYSYGMDGDFAPFEDVKSLILGTNLSF